MQPQPCEVRGEINEREQRLAKKRMAVSGNDHIRAFGEMFETSLTSWNSINVRFAILLKLAILFKLALCCKWPTVPKARATPTGKLVMHT